MKYRKRPVVIEAFQMTEARCSDGSEWPGWLHAARNKHQEDVGALFVWNTTPRTLAICTLEGPLRVTWGDYIIQGVAGELYPCKPNIFHATYENLDGTDIEGLAT